MAISSCIIPLSLCSNKRVAFRAALAGRPTRLVHAGRAGRNPGADYRSAARRPAADSRKFATAQAVHPPGLDPVEAATPDRLKADVGEQIGYWRKTLTRIGLAGIE
jgi:hypothetical protein